MSLSKKWDMNDNAYTNNSNTFNPFNNGCMCMFEQSWDGKVNKDIAIYAKCNGSKEGLLYNNRLYLSIINPKKHNKQQYETNRKWIIDNIKL